MIALDTPALIWAVSSARTATAQSEERIQAMQNRGPIIVPAPAFCEYLTGLEPGQIDQAAATISSFAMVAPFDAGAALRATKLMARPRPRHMTRQAFKVDVMILAVALAQGAPQLITTDAGFERLATGQSIRIIGMSDLVVAQSLPFPADQPSRPQSE